MYGSADQNMATYNLFKRKIILDFELICILTEPNQDLKKMINLYGKENLSLLHILIQSPYITKIKRDVAMTFTSYVANTGGLLGLCLGFSFISGVEILYWCCYCCCGRKMKKNTVENTASDQASWRVAWVRYGTSQPPDDLATLYKAELVHISYWNRLVRHIC